MGTKSLALKRISSLIDLQLSQLTVRVTKVFDFHKPQFSPTLNQEFKC